MKLLFLKSIFFLLISCTVKAQSVQQLINEANSLISSFQEEKALTKIIEALKIEPQNAFCLVKASELSSNIGNRQTNNDNRDSYYNSAKLFAETAVKLYPTSSLANTALAIAAGRQALIKSGKAKVAAVNDIKKYADVAIKLDATNHKAWHVLGRWHAEVSNLSGFERTAAKILFGSIPKASLDEAIAAFQKAESLQPNYVLNYLELAKCYKRKKDKVNAIKYIDLCIGSKKTSQDDEKTWAEAKSLKQSL